MTRATGGSAWAATSTRSRFFAYAYSRASSVVLIPSCSPFSPISLTLGTRIASLMRVCGSGRRGCSNPPERLRGLKWTSPSSCRPPHRDNEKPPASGGRGSRQPAWVEPPKLSLGGERRFRPCLPGLKGSKSRAEIRKRKRALAPAVLPDREVLVGLAIAVDDDERDLLHLAVPDPLAHGIVGGVDLDPVVVETRRQRPGVLAVPLPHRQHPDLHRREPEGEGAGVVLGEDPHEPLERPEQRAVDDVREVLGVVGAHVAEAEPLRHLRVELDRPHLPRAAERVEHVQVDLRTVEGPVALVDLVGDAAPLERRLQRALGEVPLLVGTELLLRPG